MGILEKLIHAKKTKGTSEQANQQLFQAVEKGDLESVKKALASGADINATKRCGPYGEEIGVEREWFAENGLQATPAYLALERNHTEIFDFLAQQKGFNPAFMAYADRHEREWNELQHFYADAFSVERKNFNMKEALDLLKGTATVEKQTIEHVQKYIKQRDDMKVLSKVIGQREM